MPFALLFVGLILVIAGVRNKQDQLFTLVKGDFTGQANFFFWFVSILAIGAIGYIPKLKPISTAFLALVIIVLFLKKGTGFFAQASTALQSTQTATNTTVLNPNNFSQQPNSLPGLLNLQPLGGIQ